MPKAWVMHQDDFISIFSADYKFAVSIGCSTLAEGGHLLEALQEADRLMYEEKKKKKNRQ